MAEKAQNIYKVQTEGDGDFVVVASSFVKAIEAAEARNKTRAWSGRVTSIALSSDGDNIVWGT
jgi:hypothetical protein